MKKSIIFLTIAFVLTFPLNRLVGRDFVPNEDMGEWTIHLDAPEGTALEGTQEVRHDDDFFGGHVRSRLGVDLQPPA